MVTLNYLYFTCHSFGEILPVYFRSISSFFLDVSDDIAPIIVSASLRSPYYCHKQIFCKISYTATIYATPMTHHSCLAR